MDNVNMLVEPIRESLHQIGAFLPRLLLAIVVLIIGWLVAKLVRFAIVKALYAINFNVVTEKAGIDRFLSQGGADIDTIRVLGGLFYWLVILAALMVAFNSLDLAYVTDLIGRIVLYVPRVMVAVVILVFGAYFARFVAMALATYLRNIGAREAGLMGRLALYAIMAFVIMIAVDQLGLGDIIRQTFLVVVAAVALALALAFGLGGQRRAAELIERWSRTDADEAREARDEVARLTLPAGEVLGSLRSHAGLGDDADGHLAAVSPPAHRAWRRRSGSMPCCPRCWRDIREGLPASAPTLSRRQVRPRASPR